MCLVELKGVACVSGMIMSCMYVCVCVLSVNMKMSSRVYRRWMKRHFPYCNENVVSDTQ